MIFYRALTNKALLFIIECFTCYFKNYFSKLKKGDTSMIKSKWYIIMVIWLSSYLFGCSDELITPSILSGNKFNTPTAQFNTLSQDNITLSTTNILGPSFITYTNKDARLEESRRQAEKLNQQNITSDTSFSYIQVIVCYEPEYMKAVLQETDPELPDSAIYYFDSNNGLIQICDWVYSHFNNKPDREWPIIIIPTAQYQAVEGFVRIYYPRINIIMPYMPITWTGITYPTTLTISQPPSLIMTVAGGNDRRSDMKNDWTTGNGLDFVDSTAIQYIDNSGTIYYSLPISNIFNVQSGLQAYTLAVWFSRVGWCIWMDTKLRAHSMSLYDRYNIISLNAQGQYIVTDNIHDYKIPPSSYGVAKINFPSGAATVLGAKVNRAMRTLVEQGFDATFQNVRKVAYRVNNPRNDIVGSGNFDIKKVVTGGQRFLPQIYN